MALSSRQSLYIALLVAGAFFMENLDGTVIATALPQMARSFGINPVDLNIGMTAYLLTLAVFIPISGWVADRFGARSVFGGAIIVFTVSSMLCGLSNGFWSFTGARILQGMGGAMMVPVGRLVVLRNTEKKDLMNAIAYITWPGLAAPVIGPPIGGFITTYASWRWIFFLNVPLGLLGILMTWLLVPNQRSGEKKPFDGFGFVLSGIACVCLMYGLDLVGRQEIHWLQSGLFLGTSLVFGALTLWHTRRASHPLIDLSALHIPTFAVTIWGSSLFRMAIGATPFLLPLLFQVGFGMTPFASGLLVLAVFAGNLSMKPATSAVLRRFGFRNVLIWNGLLASLSLFACSLLTATTPKPLILALLFAGGLFRSMQFTALNTIGFADVPEKQMSGASTLSSMVQQMTFGMGIAFGAICLRLSSMLHPQTGGKLIVTDFRVAFIAVGLSALVSLYDSFQLVANSGAHVSGHGKAKAEVKAEA